MKPSSAAIIPREKPIPALLEFIPTWVDELSADHRIAPALIPQFIPPPLRALYEIAGNWPVPYTQQWRPPNWTQGLFGRQDQLLPIDQLNVVGGRFEFLHENQGVWMCETYADADDPPVYSDSRSMSNKMEEVCASLSHFLTTYCLQELVFGSKHLFSVDSDIENVQQLVQSELRPIWEKGIYAYKEPNHSFYLASSDVMVMKIWEDYWIACKDDAALELVSNGPHEIRRIN